MKQASIRTFDQTILSAWQQGLSEASKDATFKQALLQQEGELLPCFVDHYERLKTLPRRMGAEPATAMEAWRQDSSRGLLATPYISGSGKRLLICVSHKYTLRRYVSKGIYHAHSNYSFVV